MASKRITQETFDAAVRENIEEFEMRPEEAVKEAVEQFESQGVDLSNIIKLVPKVSADGLQEPTHDIVQVGGGGLCGCGPMHITGSLLSVHLLSGSQMTHTGSEGQGLPSVCQ